MRMNLFVHPQFKRTLAQRRERKVRDSRRPTASARDGANRAGAEEERSRPREETARTRAREEGARVREGGARVREETARPREGGARAREERPRGRAGESGGESRGRDTRGRGASLRFGKERDTGKAYERDAGKAYERDAGKAHSKGSARSVEGQADGEVKKMGMSKRKAKDQRMEGRWFWRDGRKDSNKKMRRGRRRPGRQV